MPEVHRYAASTRVCSCLLSVYVSWHTHHPTKQSCGAAGAASGCRLILITWFNRPRVTPKHGFISLLCRGRKGFLYVRKHVKNLYCVFLYACQAVFNTIYLFGDLLDFGFIFSRCFLQMIVDRLDSKEQENSKERFITSNTRVNFKFF